LICSISFVCVWSCFDFKENYFNNWRKNDILKHTFSGLFHETSCAFPLLENEFAYHVKVIISIFNFNYEHFSSLDLFLLFFSSTLKFAFMLLAMSTSFHDKKGHFNLLFLIYISFSRNTFCSFLSFYLNHAFAFRIFFFLSSFLLSLEPLVHLSTMIIMNQNYDFWCFEFQVSFIFPFSDYNMDH
jgi:hypothetical protein